jgi:5-methylcytosine-specific restriction enzyme subunit McrC
MLRITEHYQFYTKVSEHFNTLKNVGDGAFCESFQFTHDPIPFRPNDNRKCISITLNNENALIESSYFIGLDWIKPWDMPVLVEPKMNKSNFKTDSVQMLLEALKEPENINHLDGLMEVKFEDQWINIEGDKIIELTPFLIVQFLMTVRSIIRKGLKKDYYHVTQNLNSRIKGKILVGQQIKQNIVKNRLTNTVCSYQEYGLDTEENQFLKYVLHFVQAQVENHPSLRNNLIDLLHYNISSFERVSNKKYHSFHRKINNPFYKEYNIAIQLGNQILKLMDHNLSKSANELRKYPPHWIDMSKLFELYVFKKLREKFKGSNEVVYHYKSNYQELDFIIKSGDFKAVVDAKYKPRYKTGNPSMEDARQLAGYSRLNSIYKELEIDNDQLIPVYFVYPKELMTDLEEPVPGNDFEEDQLFESDSISLFKEKMNYRESKTYRKMYLQEIQLESNKENTTQI